MSESQAFAGSIDENARRRFEDAWGDGKPVGIEDCLPSPDQPQYLATLEELVSIELEFGWRAQKTSEKDSPQETPPKVETYLERFPRLNEPAILLRLAKQEFLARHRFGDRPSVDEYRDRFPQAVQTGDEFQDVVHLARVAEKQTARITPGVVVGRYRVGSEHARGGFGLVWKAEDETLARTVAIKELDRKHTEDDLTRSRFLNEARIAASLEHPGIVPVYELQDRERGTPFYSMKMVQGQTFSEAIRFAHQPEASGGPDRKLERTRLLNTYLSVLRTMAFAHSRGVIHRDLKPDNIILGEYGETIILDWGLAKSLESGAPEERPEGRKAPDVPADGSPDVTQPGSVLGTPAYMAPEQADGKTESIDRQADVYALGAMLYEILTGVRPYKGKSSDEIIKKVLTTEPPRPRTVAADIPRPLEAICLKAMAKRRADRYATAVELSEDIERYLADLPVSVYRESVWERGARWLRRHRTVALSATGALVTVAIAAVVAAVLIDHQRQQAVIARTEAVKEKNRADDALVQAQRNLYVTRIQFARHRWDAGNVAEARALLEECPAEFRAWEWRYLWGVCHTEMRRWNLPEHLRAVDYNAGAERVAVASDTQLLLLNARTGETERRVELPAGIRRMRWLRFSGDASLVLTAADVAENPANPTGPKALPKQTRFDAWDATTGQQVWTYRENDYLADCDVSRQGDVLVAIFRREALRLLNARTGEPLAGSRLMRHRLEGPTVAVSADGKTFAVGSWGRGVSVRRVPDGQVRWSRNLGIVDVGSLALSSNGSLLAVGLRGYGSNFGRCMIYGSATESMQLPDLARPMRALAFTGDGKHLVGAGDDRSVLVWKLKGARLLRRVVGPGEMADIGLAADKLVAATVGEDGGASLWDLSRDQDAVRIEPFPMPRTAAAFGPDGSWFVDATLDIRNSNTGAITAHLGDRRSGPPSSPMDLAVSADGTLIAAAGDKREISLWRRAKPTQKSRIIPATDAPRGENKDRPRVAFSPRGSLLAGTGRGVRLWDAAAPHPAETERKLPGCDEETNSVSFSHDGIHLAASVGTQGLRIWRIDEEQPRLVHTIPVKKDHSVGPIIFSPDSKYVFAAITGTDSAVMVLDRQTGRVVRALDGGKKGVAGLTCTPDKRRLVLAGNVGEIRFIDMESWREVFRLDAQERLVLLRISPDGQHLLAANWMGRIMLWRAASSVNSPSVGAALRK